jgi:hypothetical protein
MRTRHTYVSVSLAWLFLLFMAGSAISGEQGTPTAPATTGQKIGSVVKDAIETAFPVAQKIIDLIWPDRKGSKNVKEIEAGLDKARKQFLGEAHAALKPLISISAELTVLRSVTYDGLRALEPIHTMQGLCSTAATDQRLREKLAVEWSVASTLLEKVSGVDDAAIKKLGESELSSRVIQIRDANFTTAKRLSTRLSAGSLDVPAIAADLQILSGLMTGLDAVMYAKLLMLDSDIATLAKWAGGQQGSSETANDVAESLRIADRALSSFKKTR